MTDPRVVEAESGLQSYGWSPLWVTFLGEHQQGNVHMCVCTATISTPEMAVFDAYIINGGGMMNCCNIASFPTLQDAVAYHLGKLITDGHAQIVIGSNG